MLSKSQTSDRAKPLVCVCVSQPILSTRESTVTIIRSAKKVTIIDRRSLVARTLGVMLGLLKWLSCVSVCGSKLNLGKTDL